MGDPDKRREKRRLWRDESGDQIARVAWLGLAQIPSTASDWPVQARPHDTVWSLWRKALSDSFCTKERISLCFGL